MASSAGFPAVCREIGAMQNRGLALKRLCQKLLARILGMVASGPCCRVERARKWQVNAMENLIEFYKMVSLNNAALHGSEKTAIRNARRALRMFERAMNNFKTVSTDV